MGSAGGGGELREGAWAGGIEAGEGRGRGGVDERKARARARSLPDTMSGCMASSKLMSRSVVALLFVLGDLPTHVEGCLPPSNSAHPP